MISNNNLSSEEKQYRSPKVKAVFLTGQDILSASNPDAYTTEMEEGEGNW